MGFDVAAAGGRTIALSALSANNLGRMCDRPPSPPFLVAPATEK
ncbi:MULTISPECIES: hypothetical protein [unclassified Microcoleus]